MSEIGYPRRAAARACGISARTLARYRQAGKVRGVVQYVEGSGWMRLFTQADLATICLVRDEQRAKMPKSLHMYLYGPEPDAPNDTSKEIDP